MRGSARSARTLGAALQHCSPAWPGMKLAADARGKPVFHIVASSGRAAGMAAAGMDVEAQRPAGPPSRSPDKTK